jgi:hypothetical protein
LPYCWQHGNLAGDGQGGRHFGAVHLVKELKKAWTCHALGWGMVHAICAGPANCRGRSVAKRKKYGQGRARFGQAALCLPASDAIKSSSGVISIGRPSAPSVFACRIRGRLRRGRHRSLRRAPAPIASNRRFAIMTFAVGIPVNAAHPIIPLLRLINFAEFPF